MSRYFPHAAYAEDQPLARTILTVHVLSRGFTTGAVVGLGSSAVGVLYHRLRGAKPVPASVLFSTTSATSASALRAAGLQRLLRSSGTASAVGLGMMGIALAGRMHGRERIEWRDRAWRLMESPGQLETDDWTYSGAAAGLVTFWVAEARMKGAVGGWRAAAGAAGMGSVAGTVGYLMWRYGVHAGKHHGDFAINEAALGRL
ncbi:hypothetical protein EsH8_III_000509 [Colletotrichum jinshuiense]